MSLQGEIALVTGAGKGIGEAVARALAGAGARVAVTSRVAEDAERVAASLGPAHAGFGMDVRSSAAVDEAVGAATAALGTPTILVNNAGVNRLGRAESYPDDDWERILDVNLTGVFRCCRAVGARMLETGGGSIVNVASIVGATVGMPWRAPYASSKAGVVGLTRTLAVERAERGVRVNAILPGPVRTSMIAVAIEQGAVDEQQVHRPHARGPLGAARRHRRCGAAAVRAGIALRDGPGARRRRRLLGVRVGPPCLAALRGRRLSRYRPAR